MGIPTVKESTNYSIIPPYTFNKKIFDALYFMIGLLKLKTSLQGLNSVPADLKDPAESRDNELSKLFNSYGSDKSTHHDYDKIYEELLGHRRLKLRNIVEIGIGSNDLSTPQNMGLSGRPGGSLRAFRDWAPNAIVIGADLDGKTMFSERNIATCVVNQLHRKSFSQLKELLPSGADLIVIDGLHTPRAEMNSLLELLPKLSPGGCFVIEDITSRAALLLWPFARLILKKTYFVELLEMKNGFIFVITNDDRKSMAH